LAGSTEIQGFPLRAGVFIVGVYRAAAFQGKGVFIFVFELGQKEGLKDGGDNQNHALSGHEGGQGGEGDSFC